MIFVWDVESMEECIDSFIGVNIDEEVFWF